MIYKMTALDDGIYLYLATGSEQNLKPDLVAEAFLKFAGEDPEEIPVHIHRIDVYAKNPEAAKGQTEFYNTGRSWKRCAFTDHFVMQICGCDYSGGIHCQPFYGSGRSMACVLDHGSGDCGDCVCGVSERREGIVEEIAKEII